MTKDELLSKTISYLRFPLTIGVVFIHFNLREGFSIRGVKYGIDNPEWFTWVVNLFSEVLPRTAVPLFFLISGFLFFYRSDFCKEVYKKKLQTRARTLLIPFFLWNIIAIMIPIIKKLPLLSSVFPNAYKIELHFSLARIFNTFFANFRNEGIIVIPTTEEIVETHNHPFPIDVPLWYVRDLMVVILLSPIIFWMIKRLGKWFVAALGLFWYFYGAAMSPYDGWTGLLSNALFFFSWGAYYSINRVNFVESMRKYKFAPLGYLILAAWDLCSKGADFNGFIHRAGIVAGIVALIIIVSQLLEKEKITVNMTLANSSFFVFALHTLIMREFIHKPIFTILHLPDSPYVMSVTYFTIPFITIAVCVLMYLALRRYVPTLCNLLTGGR